MKRKMCRLNLQRNADQSEYGKLLPGKQPNRIQNWRSETLYFIWLSNKRNCLTSLCFQIVSSIIHYMLMMESVDYVKNNQIFNVDVGQ